MEKEGEMSRREASKLMAFGASSLILNPFSKFELYNSMHLRKIPSTNEQIPVVGLGTWQTFDVGSTKNEREPLKEVLKILVNHGGSVIDSSPMYGRSEKVVGELTSELNIKKKIFEATKVWITGKNEGIQQMNSSINLMKAEPMDLMQVHNLVDWKTHLKTLFNWKETGKIRYIGITHYHSGGYAQMEKIMKNESLDFIQINYNLNEQDAAERILPLAQDKGIAVLINRPYDGGSLFQSIKNKKLPSWADEFDANSWGQIFLKFILANPAVTCVIPGTSKPKHMKDNVQAGFGNLPTTAHLRKIQDLLAK